jgi:hypothetical protein
MLLLNPRPFYIEQLKYSERWQQHYLFEYTTRLYIRPLHFYHVETVCTLFRHDRSTSQGDLPPWFAAMSDQFPIKTGKYMMLYDRNQNQEYWVAGHV